MFWGVRVNVCYFLQSVVYQKDGKEHWVPTQLGYKEAAEFPAFRHALHGYSVFRGKVSSQIKEVTYHVQHRVTLYPLTPDLTWRHLGVYVCVGVRVVVLALPGEKALLE